MRLRTAYERETLLILNELGGAIWLTDDWPERLKIEDALSAFCGEPVNGCYIFHEKDHRYLSRWLQSLTELDGDSIGFLAMGDKAEIIEHLSVDDTSRLACAASAVFWFMDLFKMPLHAARKTVQLNMRHLFGVSACGS